MGLWAFTPGHCACVCAVCVCAAEGAFVDHLFCVILRDWRSRGAHRFDRCVHGADGWSCTHQMPLKLYRLRAASCVLVRACVFVFETERARERWVMVVVATAQLCVFISLFSAPLSPRPSLSVAPCVSRPLPLLCLHSRCDPRLARGNARLDDFTTSTSTAVSRTNIAEAHTPTPLSLSLLCPLLFLSRHSLIPSPSVQRHHGKPWHGGLDPAGQQAAGCLQLHRPGLQPGPAADRGGRRPERGEELRAGELCRQVKLTTRNRIIPSPVNPERDIRGLRVANLFAQFRPPPLTAVARWDEQRPPVLCRISNAQHVFLVATDRGEKRYLGYMQHLRDFSPISATQAPLTVLEISVQLTSILSALCCQCKLQGPISAWSHFKTTSCMQQCYLPLLKTNMNIHLAPDFGHLRQINYEQLHLRWSFFFPDKDPCQL